MSSTSAEPWIESLRETFKALEKFKEDLEGLDIDVKVQVIIQLADMEPEA